MAKSLSPLAALSQEQQKQVKAWLGEFEKNWDDNRLAAKVKDLPPAGDPVRLPVLLGMVKVDLRRRWQKGRKVTVETYLKTFPELGPPDSVSVSLVQAEYDARLQTGAAADLGEFAKRFPRQTEEIRQELDRIAAAATLQKPLATSQETLHGAGGAQGQGQASSAPLPDQFGRYRITKCLGQGNMGTVYLARDTQLDRPVALKIPQFTSKDTDEMRERFYREARAAATIEHPHICPVHEVGELDGTHYLVMGYIEGKPLADVIAGDKEITGKQAASLVRKMAQAMAEAHKKGVIHRDLKPGNVMINKRGEPIIMDFGLARKVNKDETRLTQEGLIVGTPAYMSPEQVGGTDEGHDKAGDIYSLGVILYEMLTKRVPFQGSLTTVLAQILTQEPPPPGAFRKDLDPQLEAICLQAMAKNVADRFASMNDLAAALTDYMKSDAKSPILEEAEKPQAKSGPSAQESQSGLAYASYFRVERPATPKLGAPVRNKDASPASPTAPRKRKERPAKEKSSAKTWILVGGGLAALAAVAVIVVLVVKGGGSPGDTKKEEVENSKKDKKDSGSEKGNPEAAKKVDQGKSALDQKKYDQAIAALSEAVRIEPKNVAAFNLRGQAYLSKGDADQALTDFNEAIRLNPKDATAYKYRGSAQVKKKAESAALEDFSRAIQLDDKYAAAYNERGMVYTSQDKYQLALQDLSRAIQIDGQLADAYANRGLVYLFNKPPDPGRALEDFASAIKADPQCFKAYFQRATYYKIKKDADQAIDDFTKALRIEPAHINARNNRGLLYLDKNDLDNALADFTAVIDINPKLSGVYNNRGVIYLRKKEFPKALADFNNAIKLDPQNTYPYKGRAEVFEKTRYYKEARADLAEVLRINGKDAMAYQMMAGIFNKTRDFDDAIKHVNQAMKLGLNTNVSLDYRGQAYHGKQMYPQAIQDFDAAIRASPKYLPAYYHRGDAYRMKGELDRAIKDYTDALDLDANSPEALYGRGFTLFLKKDFPAAITDLSKAVDLGPGNPVARSIRGFCFAQVGEFDKALQDIERGMELGLKGPLDYYARGFALLGKKQYKQALSDFNEALKINPKFALAFHGRASVYQAQGNTAKAQTEYRQALLLDKDVDKKVFKASKMK